MLRLRQAPELNSVCVSTESLFIGLKLDSWKPHFGRAKKYPLNGIMSRRKTKAWVHQKLARSVKLDSTGKDSECIN